MNRYKLVLWMLLNIKTMATYQCSLCPSWQNKRWNRVRIRFISTCKGQYNTIKLTKLSTNYYNHYFITRKGRLLVHIGGGDLSKLNLNKTFMIDKTFTSPRYSGNCFSVEPMWIIEILQRNIGRKKKSHCFSYSYRCWTRSKKWYCTSKGKVASCWVWQCA